MDVKHRLGKCVDQHEQSSETILKTAHHELAATGYQALRTVRCEYYRGAVVLHGRVSTYYLKQLAQTALLTCPLIAAVVNQIEVVDTCPEVHIDTHNRRNGSSASTSSDLIWGGR